VFEQLSSCPTTRWPSWPSRNLHVSPSEQSSAVEPSLSAALAILVTLVAINAVVDIAGDIVVMEVGRVVVAVASRALEDGIVVGVDVARRAHAIRVSVIDRELRVLRVIEGCPGPRRRVVAGLAGGRKELWLRRVPRIGGVVVIGLVATDAGDGQRRVVVVDVAVGADARRHGVGSGQRERGVVVVES
jgi:hypothetical protein